MNWAISATSFGVLLDSVGLSVVSRGVSNRCIVFAGAGVNDLFLDCVEGDQRFPGSLYR